MIVIAIVTDFSLIIILIFFSSMLLYFACAMINGNSVWNERSGWYGDGGSCGTKRHVSFIILEGKGKRAGVGRSKVPAHTCIQYTFPA